MGIFVRWGTFNNYVVLCREVARNRASSKNNVEEMLAIHGRAVRTKESGPTSEKNLAFRPPKNIAPSFRPCCGVHNSRRVTMMSAYTKRTTAVCHQTVHATRQGRTPSILFRR